MKSTNRAAGRQVPDQAGSGHPASTIRFWRELVARALRSHSTPLYLFSIEPVRAALAELNTAVDWAGNVSSLRPRSQKFRQDAGTTLGAETPLPRLRHWLSCKTQPMAPLLRWWCRQGLGIEVVSEYELLAALQEGFAPGQILVNGPAKHHWLPRHSMRGLRVNFDSLAELDPLLPLARKLDWRLGVRIHTREEFDPEHPEFPTQFGLQQEEAITAIQRLQRAGAALETVHFHLRTNVASPAIYERAAEEVAAICRAANFTPKHLDVGGGLPPPHVQSCDGRRYDAGFTLAELARVHQRVIQQFPALQELWLENGRFVSARSGVLVVRVRDIKERGGLRQLICDGGRTTHALISQWEAHEILTVPDRRGPVRLTAICGATCMAFDQLARRRLPGSIQAGDVLVWMDAGAYHIPWETRFSHGWAKVLWHENGRLRVAREAESFESWWGQWK